MELPLRLIAADPVREGRGGLSPATARPERSPRMFYLAGRVCVTRGFSALKADVSRSS
jgi:hypothetical protein